MIAAAVVGRTELSVSSCETCVWVRISLSELRYGLSLQIVPGKKNVKAAMRAALAEASGFGNPDDDIGLEDLEIGTDDESDLDGGSDVGTPKLGSRSSLKHNHVASHASEPLEGAGTTRRSYQESSAPPEGAGGYQAGEFVPPQVPSHLTTQMLKLFIPNDSNMDSTGSISATVAASNKVKSLTAQFHL